jgi:hypothetical protein
MITGYIYKYILNRLSLKLWMLYQVTAPFPGIQRERKSTWMTNPCGYVGIFFRNKSR